MAESLSSLVARHRTPIIEKWFDAAVRSYAPDSAAFIRSRTDPFANPVGSQLRKGLEAVLDQLAGGTEDGIAGGLDPIVRMRAVQPLAPSQALAFVFALKAILREVIGEKGDASAALKAADARIDAVALAAFDRYMACREQIMDLKANETRNRVFRAFEKAGLVAPEPGAVRDRSTT
jgi:hypothetical protein